MHTDGSTNPKSTEGMVDYNHHSSGQQRQVASQSDHIRSLVERIGPIEPEFKVVDYGCGPGTTTINLMRAAIKARRSRFPDDPVVACHCDQPGNDWNGLFALVNSPDGYAENQKDLRVEAAVGSFYDQVAAASSVSFGTCFAAHHWLEHPVTLDAPGTVWFADLEGAARQQMAAQAEADWTKFLRRRAVELRSGAYILVASLGAVPDPDEPSGWAVSGRGPYRALQSVAQGLVDDGLLDQQALNGFVFPFWFMSADEARRPFEEDPELSKVFEVDDISVVPAPENPKDLFAAFLDDPAEYARRYCGFIRAFADSTLRTQLLQSPSAETTDRLAGLFYERLEELYRIGLAKHAFEMWHLTIVLRRT